MSSSDFLGVGWAFPIGVDARGRIGLARQVTDIEQAIQMILLTPKGQRVMRPEFGCQIHELIFAPNDANTWGMAEYYVEEALRFWEPRIEVLNVTARPSDGNTERMDVHVDYRVKATLDKRTLVYPFYRIPGE